MKKIVPIIVIISIIFLIWSLLSNHGYSVKYNVKSNDFVFNIQESYYKNRNKDIDNHYFDININNTHFTYQIFSKLKNKSITNIEYYKDDKYECILPIFENKKVLSDIICVSNNIQYFYNGIIEKPYNLVQFKENVSKKYTLIDTTSNDTYSNLGMMNIYNNNLIDNKYIILNYYKGVYIINKERKYTVELFSNDVYSQDIKALIENKYVILNYNEKHMTKEFYIIDIKTGKKTIYTSKYSFALDSILEGIVDNKLYIYDKDNKIQYEVDILNMTTNIIGNEKKGIKIYNNSNFETYKINEIKDFYFKNDSYIDDYKIIGKTGFKYSGFYYLSNNGIYRIDINNTKIKTFLFQNNNGLIKYSKDYICKLESDTISCYNDLTGLKTIIKNSEFKFNQTLSYEIYSV